LSQVGVKLATLGSSNHKTNAHASMPNNFSWLGISEIIFDQYLEW
jgi:hypothetical protein